jgi:hypothetical protein
MQNEIPLPGYEKDFSIRVIQFHRNTSATERESLGYAPMLFKKSEGRTLNNPADKGFVKSAIDNLTGPSIVCFVIPSNGDILFSINQPSNFFATPESALKEFK